jgi:hypothetical protein
MLFPNQAAQVMATLLPQLSMPEAHGNEHPLCPFCCEPFELDLLEF